MSSNTIHLLATLVVDVPCAVLILIILRTVHRRMIAAEAAVVEITNRIRTDGDGMNRGPVIDPPADPCIAEILAEARARAAARGDA